jgi:rhodanese-related sulfurtransferase
MGLFDKVKQLWGGQPQPVRPAPSLPIEPEEIAVPELAATELRAALAEPAPPLILDVREQYEWNQVHIPEALHIPMNEVPARLGDLPHDRRIAVLCAHGSRSYGVAHYLREQGFDAWNVVGGITQYVQRAAAPHVK